MTTSSHAKQILYCLFFFSSRRRHTRLQGDWSSDVCSSDLDPIFMRTARTVGTLSHLRSPQTLNDRIVPESAGVSVTAACGSGGAGCACGARSDCGTG